MPKGVGLFLFRVVVDVSRRYVTSTISQCTVLRVFAPVIKKIDTQMSIDFLLTALSVSLVHLLSAQHHRQSRKGGYSDELTFNH